MQNSVATLVHHLQLHLSKFNIALRQISSSAYSYLQPKLSTAWVHLKQLISSIYSVWWMYYERHPYLMLGISGIGCALILANTFKLMYRKPKQQKIKEKIQLSDEQSTYYQQSNNKSESDISILSIPASNRKLPMAQIMESDNEDDQDRIFFEVYSNYYNT